MTKLALRRSRLEVEVRGILKVLRRNGRKKVPLLWARAERSCTEAFNECGLAFTAVLLSPPPTCCQSPHPSAVALLPSLIAADTVVIFLPSSITIANHLIRQPLPCSPPQSLSSATHSDVSRAHRRSLPQP
ncbi:hypothetical protein B296_00016712 [Ensete ventricosum]|uniref:Uncharacterized protein n=1 Tax=Ensete ventricosum TaxID=4639 RepID=A0A426ZFS3_ENSVE|nr:hypothetical protein B296_00016712 [Ensete ventricosum]